jgi:hypothetical protein
MRQEKKIYIYIYLDTISILIIKRVPKHVDNYINNNRIKSTREVNWKGLQTRSELPLSPLARVSSEVNSVTCMSARASNHLPTSTTRKQGIKNAYNVTYQQRKNREKYMLTK